MDSLMTSVKENTVNCFGTAALPEIKSNEIDWLMSLAQRLKLQKENSIIAVQNILIVEDNDNNSELMQSLLRFHGMRSSIVRNATEAMSYCRDNVPVAIMMDIGLPDTNGLELTHMLRQIPGINKVPIVAVSAHASDRMRDLADEAGCVAFIAKPWKTKEVTEMMKKIMPSM